MTNELIDACHVDVAILYGLGQKERAQHIARELRPKHRVQKIKATNPKSKWQLRHGE